MALMNGIYRPPMNNRGAANNNDGNKNEFSAIKNIGINKNPYQQYQQNTVNTSTPQELTLMLYNGLVRFLKLAQQGIEEKDIEKANNNLIKSQRIVSEFICSLDTQYEVSEGLFAMYDYMNRRLVEANIKKDKAIVEEIIGYAEELRDTWAQAMKLAKQQAAEDK